MQAAEHGEQLGLLLRIEPQAVVLHPQHEVAGLGRAADAYPRSPLGVAELEGIAEQVVHHRAQVLGQKRHAGEGGHVDLDAGAAARNQRLQVLAHVVNHCGQGYLLNGLVVLLLQLGHVAQVIDGVHEAPDRVVHHAQHLGYLTRQRLHGGQLILQHLQQPFNVGDRRPQVVGGGVDEVVQVHVDAGELLVGLAENTADGEALARENSGPECAQG